MHTFVRPMEISVIVQTALQWNNRASIGCSNFLHISQADPQKLGDHWPHGKLCLSISVIPNIWKETSRQLAGAKLIQRRTRLVTSRKWRAAERQPVGIAAPISISHVTVPFIPW